MKPNLKFAILIVVASSLQAYGWQRFRCFDNTGKNSAMLSDVIKAASVTEGTPVIARTDISQLDCAVLCVSLGNACQSYAYNPSTKNCYVKNVSRKIPALLCSTNASLAGFKCERSGDTFVGYTGDKFSFVECACGVSDMAGSSDWTSVSSTRYKCFDNCVVNQPCFCKLGLSGPCKICNYHVLASCPLSVTTSLSVVTCINAIPGYWN